MADACEVRDPDTQGSGEQDPAPRGDMPSSPEGHPGRARGRRRRRRKARLTGLSQQRQAANARERYRTKSVQDALQQLSCCIPTPVPTPTTKLSKIEILRLASQYIEHLTNVLNENDPSGPAASKARTEGQKGTVKTRGSSRDRRSRSRQTRDHETVVYLTRRRIKDMQPADKGLADAGESNVGSTQVQGNTSYRQINSESSATDSSDKKGGTMQNNQKGFAQITADNSGKNGTCSGSESSHCEGSKKRRYNIGNYQTGNGSSERPYRVCELDVKLSEVGNGRPAHETATRTQPLSTKYAVHEQQCDTFRNITGNARPGDRRHYPSSLLLNGNGATGRSDCRLQTFNGLGTSQTPNGPHYFAGQMPDFTSGSWAYGFGDYSGIHCDVMPRPSYPVQNFSFESDDSNLSISR